MASSSRKSQRLGMPFDADLKQKVEYAAKLKAAAAAKDIEEQEFLYLSLNDRAALAKAIIEPIKPSDKSIESARAYQERFGL